MRQRALQALLLALRSAATVHWRDQTNDAVPAAPMTPMLFMLPSDTHSPAWGVQFPVAPPLVNLSAECVGLKNECVGLNRPRPRLFICGRY